MILASPVYFEHLQGVEVQWELRPVRALRDQRFAFAFPLGAHTSARSSALR